MKRGTRVLLAVVGVIGVVIGIRQMGSGAREGHDHGHDHGHGPKQPQAAGVRVSVADHGCSLQVPQGWTQRNTPNGGVMYVAPKESGYLANLMVMSEPFGGSLREYVDANINAVKTGRPAAKFKGDAEFATDSGAPSFKTMFDNKVNQLDLAQAMYFFNGLAGRKIVITTTIGHGEQDSPLGPLFDTCIKTLAVVGP